MFPHIKTCVEKTIYMNRKTFFTILCLAFAAGTPGPCGAAVGGTYPSNLIDALRTALAQRGELNIEQFNVERAEAGIKEARGANLPSLNALTTVQRVKSYQDFSGVEVNAMYNNVAIPISVKSFTPGRQVYASVELSQSVYSGGLNGARIDEREAAKRSAQAHRDLMRNQIVLEVSNAYWDLYKAQIQGTMLSRRVEHAKLEAALAQEQVDQGHIAAIDLAAKKLAVETEEMELRSQARRVAERWRRLARAMGLEPQRDRDQPPPLLDGASGQIDAALADFRFTQAPELRVTQAELDGASARSLQFKSEFKPSIDVFARYAGIGRDNDTIHGALSNYGKDNLSVGIRLKWNLFDGYRSSARVTQAALEAGQLRLKLEMTRRELENDFQEKESVEANLQDELSLAIKQAELARSRLAIATKQWETQRISRVELDEAQLKEEEARNKVRIAEIDVRLARFAKLLAMPDRGGDRG